MAKLLVNIPGSGDTLFELNEGSNKVGRLAENEIQIDDDSISGQHAEVIVSGSTITIKDLGSTNGTNINGQEVAEGSEQSVDSNSAIIFGSVTATIKGDDAPAGSQKMPEREEADGMPAAENSSRPGNFSTCSPYPVKSSKSMDGASKGVLALAVVSLLVFGFAVFTAMNLSLS
jgi:predicted component of type VI protein secretion system